MTPGAPLLAPRIAARPPALDAPPGAFLVDVRIGDGDVHETVDHVSNVEFVRWLDRAAELHTDTLGFPHQWLLDRDLMWFVARHEVDYRAEARSGDDLVIATWVRDIARTRSWRDYVIFRPADGVVVCRAATLWVLVRLTTRRPVRIPAEIRARLEPVDGATAERGVQGGSRSCTSP